MRRRQALRALGGAALGGLAGCLGGSGGPKTVDMVGLEFQPRRVSVPAGTTVEWVNESDIGHTVTAYGDRLPDGATYWASGGFASEAAARKDLQGGLIGADGTYAHTFETAGEHPYFCVPHEGSGMTGVVSVG
ncbi:MAG: plastocyanin/azurin family copper-binding protein [Halobacteriales archaeon]|nr:plastocyanin/azurin family copper-binding protein [Halobacteriales archaeon]